MYETEGLVEKRVFHGKCSVCQCLCSVTPCTAPCIRYIVERKILKADRWIYVKGLGLVRTDMTVIGDSRSCGTALRYRKVEVFTIVDLSTLLYGRLYGWRAFVGKENTLWRWVSR